MPSVLIGRDARAYWNPAEDLDDVTNDAPTWLALATTKRAMNIMDLSLDIDSEFADATTRTEAISGWASEVAVLKNGRVTFDIRWDPSDDFTAGLIYAWDQQIGISLGFTDQAAKDAAGDVGIPDDTAVVGAQGLFAMFSVGIQKQEGLKDVQKASVTLTVAKFPQWYPTPTKPTP